MQNQNTDQLDHFQLPDLLERRSLFLTVLVGQLLVMLLVVYRDGFNFDWLNLAQTTIYVQWQGILSAIVLTLIRNKIADFEKNNAALLSFIALLLVAAVVAIGAEVFSSLSSQEGFVPAHVLRNLFISAIIGGVALRYLFVQQQLVFREKAAVLASLASLQARIKPHFLFNTMNSIASLIGFAPDKAEKMVEDLSALLRESLKDERVETTIEKEWTLCERYLSIEQLRLGERLSWTSNFDVDTQLPIPSLALQPIVENAIYHGIQPALEEGYIKLEALLDEGEVVIRIENSQYKTAQSQRGNKGNKMAIGNIRHRMQQLYGSSANLSLEDNGDSFITTLRYKPEAQFSQHALKHT